MTCRIALARVKELLASWLKEEEMTMANPNVRGALDHIRQCQEKGCSQCRQDLNTALEHLEEMEPPVNNEAKSIISHW